MHTDMRHRLDQMSMKELLEFEIELFNLSHEVARRIIRCVETKPDLPTTAKAPVILFDTRTETRDTKASY